mgnify:FL=1
MEIDPDLVERVSTLAVEWIEISNELNNNGIPTRLHPRGGVD